MIKLSIEELKPGMVLAQPVYNGHGVLLLESGARISRKNIRIFKSWGVPRVTVKGGSGSAESREEAAALDAKIAIERRLRKKFADVLDDPVMTEIFKAASQQLARDLQARENNHESD